MNFLAHIYLSRDNQMVGLANLVADKIKGREYLKYQPKVQRGVLLHRQIDTFTDRNPYVFQITKKLFPKYRHYSRVIVDMYFDHFLSCHWSRYHSLPLKNYTDEFYAFALQHKSNFPKKIQFFIERLVQNNWLMQYKNLEDLRTILWQMEQRCTFPCHMSQSVDDLKANYHYFEKLFFKFFEQINKHFNNNL